MSKVTINAYAPDFTLDDFQGNPFTLSHFRGESNVLLVFNRGFAWPFCRAHMAQLRQDFEMFDNLNTKVVVVGPENIRKFKNFWAQHVLPFTGLPDALQKVLILFGQEVKLFKFGRMPAQVIVDKEGIVRYGHYGNSMSDIPKNTELLEILSELQ